ncbi:MAG: hypothetical protein SH856_12740 [Flavobacteriales bacterium]|nr:hypothetical protein [Flavobacteriales bacterium]
MKLVPTIFISVILLLPAAGASAQSLHQHLRMDIQMRPTNVDSVVMYTLELTESKAPHFTGVLYTNDRLIKARGMWLHDGKQFREDGQFVFFYENGTVESSGQYDRGYKVGEWKRFADSGVEKPVRYYNPETAERIRQIQATAQAKE